MFPKQGQACPSEELSLCCTSLSVQQDLMLFAEAQNIEGYLLCHIVHDFQMNIQECFCTAHHAKQPRTYQLRTLHLPVRIARYLSAGGSHIKLLLQILCMQLLSLQSLPQPLTLRVPGIAFLISS